MVLEVLKYLALSSMARAVLFFNHWHMVILACACIAVWYVTKTWTSRKVIQIIQSLPSSQAVVMQPPVLTDQPRMNVKLMPTHIPDNPARDTSFARLTPAKVVGTLINNAAEASLRLLPLYAQVCPKSRWKWYYFTRIGPGPDAMVVAQAQSCLPMRYLQSAAAKVASVFCLGC